MSKTALHGAILAENKPPHITDPVITVNGKTNGMPTQLLLDRETLSQHVMLIGGTGCGKTNAFYYLVDQTKRSMTEDDVMIVFDTKGDYHRKFYDSKTDKVITASAEVFASSDKWNVFKEILIDGSDRAAVNESANEIAWSLFSESVAKNNSNPFFPNAARDLFAAILICMIRAGQKLDPNHIDHRLHNEIVKHFLDSLSMLSLKQLFQNQIDQSAVLTYIGDGQNPQGLGVLAEMQTVARKIFAGGFSEKGDFSVREFVRNRGAKTLFIEYDLKRGATLTPIYKLLIDLAFKEAMARNGKDNSKAESKGNVYIFCDEFKLLPDLQHIDDAVNFGRSLGVKIFAGLQSIDQLTANYGEAGAKNIIAGFSSVMSFRANDESTRQFTIGKYGKNYVLESYNSNTTYAQKEELRWGTVVEDWEICGLQRGEAIVGLPGHPPFKFHFNKYTD